MFDRKKYKATRLSVIEREEEEVKEYTGYDSAFDKIEDGRNKFRIYPKHEESIAYVYPKVSHWIPVEVEKDDKKEWKRLPVLDARKHGGFKKDIVDEYVRFVRKKIKTDDYSTKEEKRILEALKAFSTGIEGSSSWVMYISRGTVSGWQEPKLLDFSASVKTGLNSLSITEDEDDPMAIDSFSDIDNGRPIIIKYNSKEKDNKKKYIVNKLDKVVPLTDDQLTLFEDYDTLESLYGKGSYLKEDFEKELNGIQRYDEENEIGVFGYDEWLDICEELQLEVDKFFSEEAPEEIKDKKEKSKVELEEKVEPKEEVELEEEEEVGESIDQILNAMDRTELKLYIKDNKLSIKVYKNYSDSVIREKILNKINPKEEVEEEVEEKVEEKAVLSAAERLAKMKASLKKQD